MPESSPPIPRFPAPAERDARYADWVAAGGIMRPGLECYTAGRLCKYTDRGWSDV